MPPNEILLAKPILSEGWIDTAIGEPYLIRDSLFKYFKFNSPPTTNVMFDYPYPQGYAPLVEFLQEQYQYPVVITNGAKQALGAVFYAISQLVPNKEYYLDPPRLKVSRPYWALIPQLAEMHGLTPVHQESEDTDSILYVAPNNPDGSFSSTQQLKQLASDYHNKHMLFIHDAAYYTHSYLPHSTPLEVVGDAQIFSVSKMLGISGLRLGFIVCSNQNIYSLLREYMENMTMGVSNFGQACLLDLLQQMKQSPTLTKAFQQDCFNGLVANKKLIKQINPAIVSVPDQIETIPGMFLWAPCHNFQAFQQAKINVIEGTTFGQPGFVRMNLALPAAQIQEIVERLSSVEISI